MESHIVCVAIAGARPGAHGATLGTDKTNTIMTNPRCLGHASTCSASPPDINKIHGRNPLGSWPKHGQRDDPSAECGTSLNT